MVDFTKQPGDAVVIIYNLLGQEISNEPYTGNDIYSKELNNNELGYILIKVRQGDKITTKKLFISQL
jgi:selenophosphate synthetase-related protein